MRTRSARAPRAGDPLNLLFVRSDDADGSSPKPYCLAISAFESERKSIAQKPTFLFAAPGMLQTVLSPKPRGCVQCAASWQLSSENQIVSISTSISVS